MAESRRQKLADRLKEAKFFSLLLDGSTDKGNIDNQVLLTVLCDMNGTEEKVHTKELFHCVPASVCFFSRFVCH